MLLNAKKRFIRHPFLFLLTLLLAALLGGCAAGKAPRTKQQEASDPFVCQRVIVGMDMAFPPFTFLDEQGRPAGIEADFARALAKPLGCPVRIRRIPWHRLPEALKEGKIDIIMSGVSITRERMRQMRFCRPYLEISQMALMRLDAQPPNPDSRGRGMRVGYLRHTTAQTLVLRRFSEAKRFPLESLDEGLVMLQQGQIDYLFADAPTVWYYTAIHPLDHVAAWTLPYTRESIAWAVAPGNLPLQKRLDAILTRWLEEGYLHAVIQKWMPVWGTTLHAEPPLTFQ